jgi:hypothetical protein
MAEFRLDPSCVVAVVELCKLIMMQDHMEIINAVLSFVVHYIWRSKKQPNVMFLGMWLIRVKIPVITLEDKDVCPFNNFSGTLVTLALKNL